MTQSRDILKTSGWMIRDGDTGHVINMVISLYVFNIVNNHNNAFRKQISTFQQQVPVIMQITVVLYASNLWKAEKRSMADFQICNCYSHALIVHTSKSTLLDYEQSIFPLEFGDPRKRHRESRRAEIGMPAFAARRNSVCS